MKLWYLRGQIISSFSPFQNFLQHSDNSHFLILKNDRVKVEKIFFFLRKYSWLATQICLFTQASLLMRQLLLSIQETINLASLVVNGDVQKCGDVEWCWVSL